MSALLYHAYDRAIVDMPAKQTCRPFATLGPTGQPAQPGSSTDDVVVDNESTAATFIYCKEISLYVSKDELLVEARKLHEYR
jgi:hypothetical protein